MRTPLCLGQTSAWSASRVVRSTSPQGQRPSALPDGMTWMPSRKRSSQVRWEFAMRRLCAMGSTSRYAEAAPPEQLRVRAAACAPSRLCGSAVSNTAPHKHKGEGSYSN